MLQLQNLKASVNDKSILNGLNLEIKSGEVHAIMGPNGSGKSTLLRVMSGIYQPDEGKAMASGPVNLLSNVRIGFNGNLSGRENAYLYGSILGHSRQTMDSLMQSIIEFAELEAFVDQPLRTYSSGMQARLGLSVASAVQPEILLIDEVLAVGDEGFKDRSRERIKSMVQDAATVVIVSHDQDFLNNVITDVIHLDQQKLTYYRGNYEHFKKEKLKTFSAQVKAYEKQQKDLKKLKAPELRQL